MSLSVLIGPHSLTVFAQCLGASKPRVEIYSMRPFGKNQLLKTARYLASSPRLRYPRTALNTAAFWRRQDILARVQSLRAFISSSSSSTRPKHERTNLEPLRAATEQRTSLVAVPIYETSPASIGIDGWFGYEEFIPAGAILPCSKSVTLVSAFDYIRESSIQVCGYLPGPRLRVDLADFTVHGIRKAKKEKTTIKATMLLRTDLTGRFTARFVPEDGGASAQSSINFHGGQVLVQGDGSSGESVQSSSFVVVDGLHDAWTPI
ncbi:MAG: hypothetical protein Q9184_000249 [Pyrenodesmia sp. 2 TL-2023]